MTCFFMPVYLRSSCFITGFFILKRWFFITAFAVLVPVSGSETKDDRQKSGAAGVINHWKV